MRFGLYVNPRSARLTGSCGRTLLSRLPRTMPYSTYGGVPFEQITPSVAVHRPADVRANAPIVLVLGWMDSKLQHVSKYAIPYTELYPGSVVVMNTIAKWDYLCNFAARDADANKLIDSLPELTNGSRPDLLVHSFSNGGLGSLHTILVQLRARNGQVSPLAHIMDSSPGRMTMKATEAFSLGTQGNGFQQYVQGTKDLAYTRALTIMRFLKEKLTGTPETLDYMREFINKPESWMAETLPPRLYVYTTADEFIDAADVESHARQALAKHRKQDVPFFEAEKHDSVTWPPLKEKPVRLYRWDTLPHVSLGRKDPKKYWSNVKSFIDEAYTLNPEARAKL